MDTKQQPRFAELLEQAVTTPGRLHAGYSAFWNYSLGNVWLAIMQCHQRGIELGPLASYNKWKELGRHVRKGERAIELCMPIQVRVRDKETGTEADTAYDGSRYITRFVYKRNWFVLAQTDGQPYQAPALPNWDKATALATLGITEEPFKHTNGNCFGYAYDRVVAVSPLAASYIKTLAHELAHVILDHTTERQHSEAITPRDIRELEAEATAMLVCDALGIDVLADCRGYCQAWYRDRTVPEASARRIFKAADMILKAGRAQTEVLS